MFPVCLFMQSRTGLLVLGVGLDTADVVGFHLMQRFHQLCQLFLEAAAYTAELVPLPNLAAPTLRCLCCNLQLDGHSADKVCAKEAGFLGMWAMLLLHICQQRGVHAGCICA